MKWKAILVTFLALVSLALTPTERNTVERAKEYIVHAQSKAQEQQLVIEETDRENARLDQIAQGQQTQIITLSGQIDEHYKNEKKAIEYNQYAKPIIDQVNKWWGLGAFVYGAKVLSGHLLILALVISLAAGVLYALSFAFPFIGLAFRFVRRLFSRVVNIIRRK